MEMNLNELRENMANTVATGLKKGEILWHNQNLPSSTPKSLSSGRRFGGINALYLLEKSLEKGYDNPFWVPHPGEQTNVEPEKKIIVKQGEKGTKVEHWGQNKDDKSKIEPRTVTYFSVEQVHYKALEQYENKFKEAKIPDYTAADGILKKFGVTVPKEKDLKKYHAALTTAFNEIGKDSPILDKVSVEDLKKLRIDMGASFLTLSLGMGVPEADKSLPTSSWASSIGHDPRQLASAARDAQLLASNVLEKGLNIVQSNEKANEKLSPEKLKVGDKILCKKESNDKNGREFVGEVKSIENEIIVASVLKNGETKEYKNLHERGWTYESFTQEQELGKASKIEEKSNPLPHLEVGKEITLTKIPDGNQKKNNAFVATVTEIDGEKMTVNAMWNNTKYTFNLDVLAKKWKVEEVAYDQSMKCAKDKVKELKEQKILVSEKEPAQLSHYQDLKCENARLLDETPNTR
jgi:antirestriction protein ArdC